MKTGYFSLVTVYLLINMYLVLRTRSHLKTYPKISKKVHIILLIIWILLASLPLFGAFLPEDKGLYTFQKYGNIFLGFLAYYAMILTVSELVLLIVKKVNKQALQKAKKIVLITAFAGSLLINIYGTFHAQNTQYITYDVELNESKGRQLKIVLLGDLHLSTNSNIEMTERMVQMVNDADADMVLIAGDVFTSSYNGLKDPEKYAAALSQMQSKYGTYVVYGNHDVDETLFGGFSVDDPDIALRPETMDEFMIASNFHMLADGVETFEDLGIQIVGRVDGEKDGLGEAVREDPETLLSKTDEDYTRIVLEHEPWDFKALAENGADIILCGHTHAGQIFPGNLIVPFFNDNGYGYKELYGIPTIVTAGVGYYGPPLRVGTNSEVTIVNLTY